jgi:hypothetical protein
MPKVLCPECTQTVEAQPKVNFLGFPKFMCTSCHRVATHPLSTARLVFYALIAVVAIGWSVKVAVGGAIPIMGVIPALMLAAVIIDFGVRSRMTRARNAADQARVAR